MYLVKIGSIDSNSQNDFLSIYLIHILILDAETDYK